MAQGQSRVIVVSGLPASGKSTLGRRLAEELGVPLFDKDDYLEALFPVGEPVGSEARHALSRQADAAFVDAVAAAGDAVAVSFWRHPGRETTSGTPTDWLADVDDVVEVHCVCDMAVAAQRFVDRRRHPGHVDTRRTAEDVTAWFTELAAFGPLDVGRVAAIDTSQPVSQAHIRDLIDQLS